MKELTLVIIAGGKGTRLKDAVGNIPKCLVPIGGKPILQYQLELANTCGVENVIMLTGHLSEQVDDFLAENDNFGLNITCIKEEQPLGTAGCFNVLKDRDLTDLLIVYGDIFCNFDFVRLYEFYKEKEGIGALITHPNNHPYD